MSDDSFPTESLSVFFKMQDTYQGGADVVFDMFGFMECLVLRGHY